MCKQNPEDSTGKFQCEKCGCKHDKKDKLCKPKKVKDKEKDKKKKKKK